jgi:hypothetical protein
VEVTRNLRKFAEFTEFTARRPADYQLTSCYSLNLSNTFYNPCELILPPLQLSSSSSSPPPPPPPPTTTTTATIHR